MKFRFFGSVALAGVLVFAGMLPASAATPVWSPPVELSATGYDADSQQVVAAPDGALTSVWSRFDGSNNVVQSSSSADQGTTWSAPVDVSAPGEGALGPQLVAAPNGTLIAVWIRVSGGTNVVQASASADQGTTWSAPVDISVAGLNTDSQQIVAAPDGTLTAVWRRHDGSGYLVQSSSSVDHGATWTAPVDLSAPGQSAESPQLVAALDGTLTAVWYRSDGSNYRVQSSTSVDHGATWSAPANLSDPGQQAFVPQLVAAPDGTLTVLWYRSDGSHYIVQSSTSANHGGTWSVPVDVSVAGQTANGSQIVVASDGTLTAVWKRQDPGNYIVQSSSSVDQGLTWSAPVDVSVAGQNAWDPQVVVAVDGVLTAAWRRSDGSNFLVQSSSSVDQGLTWSAPVALSVAGQDAFEPQLVAAPNRMVTAVWYRFDGSNFVVQSSSSRMAPTITSGAPFDPEVGTAYSFQVTASGAPTPVFSVTSGSLPTGLTLSAAGLISGTPTSVGDFAFTVSASNGLSPDAAASYTLTVAAAAVLAATGSETAVPWSIAALLLLVLGGGLMAVSRVRTRKPIFD